MQGVRRGYGTTFIEWKPLNSVLINQSHENQHMAREYGTPTDGFDELITPEVGEEALRDVGGESLEEG